MPSTLRQRAGWVVLALAALAVVLAVWAWLTGGFRVYVFGIPLSARGEHRAAAVAGALGALGVLLLDRDLRRTRAAVARGIADGLRLSHWIARHSPQLLTALGLVAATPLAATPAGHVVIFRGVLVRPPPPPLTTPRASGCSLTRVDSSGRDQRVYC
jgi:hypothetical protein